MEFKKTCLIPGLYQKYLLRWYNQFSSKSIYLIEFDSFKTNPHDHLHNLQKFLGLQNIISHEAILAYNIEKSIFTLNKSNSFNETENKLHLQIDPNSKKYLERYYKEPNKKLKKLLSDLNHDLPTWL